MKIAIITHSIWKRKMLTIYKNWKVWSKMKKIGAKKLNELLNRSHKKLFISYLKYKVADQDAKSEQKIVADQFLEKQNQKRQDNNMDLCFGILFKRMSKKQHRREGTALAMKLRRKLLL